MSSILFKFNWSPENYQNPKCFVKFLFYLPQVYSQIELQILRAIYFIITFVVYNDPGTLFLSHFFSRSSIVLM